MGSSLQGWVPSGLGGQGVCWILSERGNNQQTVRGQDKENYLQSKRQNVNT